MSSFIVCVNCGSTLSEKYFKFHEEVKKRKNIEDNRDLFKKLNITRQCCKITINTSLPDKIYNESLLYTK